MEDSQFGRSQKRLSAEKSVCIHETIIVKLTDPRTRNRPNMTVLINLGTTGP